MRAKVDPATGNCGDQKTCRDNTEQAPAPVVRLAKDVSGNNAVKHSGNHRVAAGKAVTCDLQNGIVEMRTGAMKCILQDPVEQPSTSNG